MERINIIVKGIHIMSIFLIEMDSNLMAVFKNSGIIRVVEEKLTEHNISDYKPKIVRGLYHYNHYEHPNGSFIQAKIGPERKFIHQDQNGNRKTFYNYDDLKNHVNSLS